MIHRADKSGEDSFGIRCITYLERRGITFPNIAAATLMYKLGVSFGSTVAESRKKLESYDLETIAKVIRGSRQELKYSPYKPEPL